MWPNVMEALPHCSQEPLLIKQDLKLSFKVHLTIHEVKVETIQTDIKPLFCVFRVQGSERGAGSEGRDGGEGGGRGGEEGRGGERAGMGGEEREEERRGSRREEGAECTRGRGKWKDGCVFYNIYIHMMQICPVI